MFTVLIFGIITSFILLILSVSYFYWNEKDQKISETSSSFHYTAVDVKDYEAYKTVYNRIASKLETTGGYDDGTYAPILLRLAWHSSATYDSKSRTVDQELVQ